MFGKLKTSFVNINHKLFVSQLLMGLIPTIYTTLRVLYLGNLPDDSSYSIAGQLSWINLIYEIIDEAIILPLFYFLGKELLNKKELANRMKTGLLLTFFLYIILTTIVIAFTKEMLKLMATNQLIIETSSIYIRIESIANVAYVLFRFALVGLITLGKHNLIYITICAKLILCILLDIFLVSTLSFSANLGVNGIGITNIIVNSLLFFIAIFLLTMNNISLFNSHKMSFAWMKELLKISGISGLESLVRNLTYMIMIVRMINTINEQGAYWVATNFIWAWMLLPILQLGELIKQETSTNKNAVKNNTLGYFLITLITIVIWSILIPSYKPFMQYVLNFDDPNKLFEIVIVSFGFYTLFAIQNVFDATFYGLGKTQYMFFETIVTNTFYYGILYAFYKTSVWQPTLMSIVLFFGGGIVFDTIISFCAYCHLLKKYHINIWKVEMNKNDKIISKVYL